jgi:hypothetical protein
MKLHVLSQGFSFIPFGFDTFGAFSEDAITLLARLQISFQQCLREKDDFIENYAWQRISYAIFKGIAMQLVSRWLD